MEEWITVETDVKAPIEKVWSCWNDPKHIPNWNFASDEWCAPWAKNDLRVGGKLIVRMKAKDKSAGFDLEGTYTAVEEFKKIEFDMGDRKVKVHFSQEGDVCKISESFHPDKVFPHEMQRAGWQAILNNFKKYVERLVPSSDSALKQGVFQQKYLPSSNLDAGSF
jgi:uncharacterized protein YndB with AHSA1/START domain